MQQSRVLMPLKRREGALETILYAKKGHAVQRGKPIPSESFVGARESDIVRLSDGVLAHAFDIYVTFLFESKDFLSADQVEIQKLLNRTVWDFGEKIGENALAIWFVMGRNNTPDIQRSRAYMRKFGLSTKKAPHIVITRKHPDDWKMGNEKVCISLNRTPIDRVPLVLAGIADYVQKNQVPWFPLKLRVIYEGLKKWFDDHKEDIRAGSEVLPADWSRF